MEFEFKIVVKAANSKEAANKVFNELYGGSSNLIIEGNDMTELKK